MHTKINRTTKVAAMIAGILLFITILFSAFFIAVESHHDCCGEDCPICYSIEQCINTLHNICDGIICITVVAFPILVLTFLRFPIICDLIENTLVSQKVRLDN